MADAPDPPLSGLPTDPQMSWPPPEGKVNATNYRKWGAWYSGDVDRLTEVYAGLLSTADSVHGPVPRSMLPFAAGTRERMFWGTIGGGGNALRVARLHIPLASDIAMTSADLLFGEMPTLYMAAEDDGAGKPAKGKGLSFFRRRAAKMFPSMQAPTPGVDDGGAGGQAIATPVRRSDKPTQDYIDSVVESEGIQAALLEAAEICSAYSGVYVRVVWDEQIAEHPFLGAVTPDQAIPEWRSNRLSAVTFWRELQGSETTGVVWRHLERYEPGQILHGLYKGTTEKIGVSLPLTAHPATAQFEPVIATGAKGLAVEYFPNICPDRDNPLSPYGRSDYHGIDGTMDALDEAWTSWMRDLRLAKARLMISDHMLKDQGRGKGAVWDAEQEIYQTFQGLSLDTNATGNMMMVQFNIRVAEHQQTTTALTAVAVRGAGYSVQTFGEAGDGMATATEVNARESRSNKTRARKIGYWGPGLRRLIGTLLEIAIEQFGPDGVKPIRPQVEFSDGVARDPESVGKAVQMLRAAEAASTYTLVKMVNPDWSDDQIREEVDRIREDVKATMPPILDIPGAGSGGNLDGPPSPKPAPATTTKPDPKGQP